MTEWRPHRQFVQGIELTEVNRVLSYLLVTEVNTATAFAMHEGQRKVLRHVPAPQDLNLRAAARGLDLCTEPEDGSRLGSPGPELDSGCNCPIRTRAHRTASPAS